MVPIVIQNGQLSALSRSHDSDPPPLWMRAVVYKTSGIISQEMKTDHIWNVTVFTQIIKIVVDNKAPGYR